MTDPVIPEEPIRSARPVRGLLWGLMFGLGLTILAVVTNSIVLAPVPMLVTLVAGTLIGILWSMFGPAKKAKLSS